jgi:hypothetical protein
MLLADAVVGSHQPSFQIRECDVDHRKVGIGFRAIATLHLLRRSPARIR